MKVFPWRPRAERRTAVEQSQARAREAALRAAEATVRAQEAREKLPHALALKEDLTARAADNHFFQAIRVLVNGNQPERG